MQNYLQINFADLAEFEQKFDTLPCVNDVSLLPSLDKICYMYTKELARNRLINHKCCSLEKNLRAYRNYAIHLK